MNAIIRNLVILAVMMTVLSVNPKPTSAQSIADCASQEGCLAILGNHEAVIYRKDTVKGVIPMIGNDSGAINVNNGWIVVGRKGNPPYHPNVFLYNIATGTQCSANVGASCEHGVVWLHPSDPAQSYAYFVCPESDVWTRVPLDCSAYVYFNTSGSMVSSITLADDKIHMLSTVSGRIVMHDPLTLWEGLALTYQDNAKEIRYWNNGVDPHKIFMTSGDEIMYKDVPVLTDPPSPFYTLPTSAGPGNLAVSQTHILTAKRDRPNAYLVDIANPTTHIVLPVLNPNNLAISPDTAYVGELSTPMGIKAFDMTGTLMYTIDYQGWDIAYIQPVLPPQCGNNLVEPGEPCDGTDFDGVTCADYGFDDGPLSCSVSCDAIFTSGCWRCGDGTLNPGEACDDQDLGGASCTAVGYANGEVSCRADCAVDYSQCYTCNNGLIEGAEECEGADLQGATCESEGFVGGTLTCTNCMLDTSTCHMCGNEFADEGELCDGTHTPGKICQTMGAGYTSGQLLCAAGCATYDTSSCNTCGDGVVNSPEECDGANLNEQTCASLGLGSGTLSCFENCTWNFNGCSGVQTEYCGNGNIDPGEECDDGNRSNSDDCSEFCKIIPLTCGVGGIDPGEECDGEELNAQTCESLGYETGVLYCGSDCRLRKEGCAFVAVPQNIKITLEGEPESGELNESLAQQYAELKSTLTYNCVSQTVGEDTVITTTEGSYCAIRALDLDTGDKLFSFIFVPENPLERENPVIRFYQNGTIAQTFGGHISAYQGLEVKAVLVQDRLYNVTQNRISSMGMKFLAVNPDTQSRGRWLALNVGVGSTKFCTDEAGTNCALFLPEQGELIIPLDALEDMSDLGWKAPKDPGGCSCTTGTNNSSNSSLPLLFSALAMALLWRRRNRVR